MSVRILNGDCRGVLKTLADESVHCIVTSPPYFGLRDYGVAGQIGLEDTPSAFVAEMVAVFREARRVLRSDGTLWLNLGDSYAGSWGAQGHRVTDSDEASWHGSQIKNHPKRARQTGTIREAGLKAKDLIGIPWQVAFALRADGWYLRKDIIWHKPNPMPESVTDRPTSSHDHVFLFAKSQRYFYDADAIRETLTESSVVRLSQPNIENQQGSSRAHAGGKANGAMKAVARNRGRPNGAGTQEKFGHNTSCGTSEDGGRNARDVWTIATQPYSEAHFATFPPALAERCIKAGCPAGGIVLDPFGGAGTTGLVADRLGRSAILIELNPTYAELATRRIDRDAGMFSPIEGAVA